MDERSELRKMPKGERCPECGSQRWYLQDGLRFCSRGHQIEGFIQFDVGDEQDSGQMGNTIRRQKERREAEKRQLSGHEGKALYLEALQLLIRNQVLFLVRDKGYPAELETVLRDLWDLRIRGFGSLVPEENAPESELEIFSSQPASDSEEKQTPWKSRSKAQSWDPERGSDWPIPRVQETLSLCYIGCLLLRLPARIADVHTWVTNGNMPYTQVFHELPREMQDRMPSAYVKVLKMTLRSSLRGDELYETTIDLVMSYKLNYDMRLPELNYLPVLIQCAKELVLPIEVLTVARRLAACLGLSFFMPASSSRVVLLDHPEIKLIALLTVSTKLCFPFQDDQQPVIDAQRSYMPHFDWSGWNHAGQADHIKREHEVEKQQRLAKLHPSEIVKLKDEDFDAFLAHVTRSMDIKGESPVAQFFPQEPEPQAPSRIPDKSEDEIDQEAQTGLSQATRTSSGSDKELPARATDRLQYDAFRDSAELSGTVRAFYKAAGRTAGISLEAMTGAIYMLEQRIVSWQKKPR